MPRLVAFFILPLFLVILPLSAFGWSGKVVRVADGDTITVLRGKEQVKVRLYGIDTPEMRQAYGNAAKKFTLNRVAGKTVEVEELDVDRYGRIVGWVTLDSESVNRELVRDGYAWVYRKYCRHPVCSSLYQLESRARQGKLGLWKEKEPVAPWEWRKAQRGN